MHLRYIAKAGIKFRKSNSHLLKSNIRKLKARIQKITSYTHSTRVK